MQKVVPVVFESLGKAGACPEKHYRQNRCESFPAEHQTTSKKAFAPPRTQGLKPQALKDIRPKRGDTKAKYRFCQ
jgi:hypothetical protein